MKCFLLVILLLNSIFIVWAQQVTISGRVVQHGTKETLLSAYVTDTLSRKTAITNQSGFYSLSVPKGAVCLHAHFVGFDDQIQSLNLIRDTVIHFYLNEKSEALGEVVIRGEVPVHEQTLLGKTMLSIEKIEAVPSFAGIPDLMKAITIIPGISTGREGRSNIYVRGGDRGQNLILLDGAKLYNTSHFGGFVSLFNADVIKQVDVYKGGFPSRYGGRASSVIDIITRDGNREAIHVHFSLGLLNSSVSIDGPLNNKISFVAALRTTYYDLFTISARREYNNNPNGEYYGYTFFDGNAKLTYHVADNHKLFVNFYSGHDFNKSTYKKQLTNQREDLVSRYNIHNTCATIGDRVTLSSKLLWQNTVTFSNYENVINNADLFTDHGVLTKELYQSSTTIDELNLQSRVEYYASDKHSFKGGFEYSNYRFVPGIQFTGYENSGTGFQRDISVGYFSHLTANELSIYLEDDVSLSDHFFVNVGLRGVSYFCKGKSYWELEPRISLRTMLTDNLSFKANYSIMNQFNHQIVSTYGVFEKEVWAASTGTIPPQRANQVSGGLFASVKSLKLELSAEGYYKTMTNLLEYDAPANDDIAITDLDNMLIKGGKGEAYGLELQSKYKNQRMSVDVGYVLSWNYRQFDQINHGERYPFLYDRRHEFSILTSIIMGKHYSLNSNFIFSTGTPFTVPDAYVKGDGYSDYYAFTGINNYRMPNYHRLDLSIVKKELTRKGRVQQFTLNLYNAYARQNPVYIYFSRSDGKLYQKSMFSIIPTISYSLEF